MSAAEKEKSLMDQWLTEAEVIAKFHTSKKTMQRLRRKGLHHSKNIGRGFVYLAEDINQLLLKNYSALKPPPSESKPKKKKRWTA